VTKEDVQAVADGFESQARHQRETLKERMSNDLRKPYADESSLTDAEKTRTVAWADALDNAAYQLRSALATSETA